MPTITSVHVDAPLSRVAVKYKNPAFIGELIAPVVLVKKESDKYYVFRREELRDMDSLRAAGAEANEVSWDVDTESYMAEEYALKHLVPDRIVANADAPVKPKMTTTRKLTKWIRLGSEKRVQAIAQSTTIVTNNAAPGTQWDSGTTEDPEEDVDDAKESIRSTAGVEPNAIMMSSKVWRALRRWLKDQSTNLTYRDMISIGKPPDTIWELKLIVAGSIENTANEGQADAITDIWNDNVLVFYQETAPSLETLSFMYTFRARNFRVKTWREEPRDGVMIECGVIQDEVTIAADAAYLITDVLA